MDWGKNYDFFIDILSKVVEVGNYAFTWLTTDISIGTYTFKPIYISVPILFALIALWLKNKVMGDLG